ncbi:MAG: ABC transporter substrate-binding protein [Thermoprotei archaeon]|nr:MAG: ABC transporter substrate-binding protein [Thermoprotei archaeon]
MPEWEKAILGVVIVVLILNLAILGQLASMTITLGNIASKLDKVSSDLGAVSAELGKVSTTLSGVASTLEEIAGAVAAPPPVKPPPVKVAEFHGAAEWPRPPGYHGNPFAPGGVGGCYWYVYEPLFFYLPGNGTYVPRLGLSFEVREAGKVVVVKLRKGVTWHDGTPFTSKDVVCHFHITGGLLGWPWRIAPGVYLESVEAPDDYTVVFRFTADPGIALIPILGDAIRAPYHYFGEFLEDAKKIIELRKKIWAYQDRGETPPKELTDELAEAEKAFREKVYEVKPKEPFLTIPGTGPFIVKKVTESVMILEKNEKHWAAATTYIGKIIIYFWTSNEVVWSLLMAGKIDAAHPATPPDVTEQIFMMQPRIRLALPSDLGDFCIALNYRKIPFNDLAFRKALAYAIDRVKLRKVCYYYGADYAPWAHGILPTFMKLWLTPEQLEKLPQYPYDPKKAEEILLAAGYKKINGRWYMPDGKTPIKFEIVAPAAWSDWVLAAEEIARQLTEFGFDVKARPIPNPVYGPTLKAGKYDAAIEFGFAWWGSGHPATGYMRVYGPTGYIRIVTAFPANQTFDTPWGPLSPEELAMKLQVAPPEEQKDLVFKLAWISSEYVPVIPFLEKRLVIFHLDGVRITGWPPSDDPVWTIAPGGIERCYVILMTSGILKPAE